MQDKTVIIFVQISKHRQEVFRIKLFHTSLRKSNLKIPHLLERVLLCCEKKRFEEWWNKIFNKQGTGTIIQNTFVSTARNTTQPRLIESLLTSRVKSNKINFSPLIQTSNPQTLLCLSLFLFLLPTSNAKIQKRRNEEEEIYRKEGRKGEDKRKGEKNEGEGGKENRRCILRRTLNDASQWRLR